MDLEAYVDVVPWLLFVVVDRRSGLGLPWAAASAAACGAGIAAWSYWRRRQTPVGWIAVSTFGGLTVLGLGADLRAPWFEPTLRSGSVLLLAAAAFASLHGRPLSEAYTSDRVAPPRRADEAFVRVNRRITTTWGVAAVIVGASFAGDAFSPSPVVLTLCDWVVPIVVVACAVRWVTVQWSAYLDRADGPSASGLADASVGSLCAESEPVRSAGTSTSTASITYLRRARTGR